MEKPVTVKIEDTRQAIVDAVNGSGLHPFILDAMLKDIYNEIHILYINQLKHDRKEYEKSQNHDKPAE